MIKAVIVDDEINNREVLRQMLSEYVDEVDVVDEAADVTEAIQSIEN